MENCPILVAEQNGHNYVTSFRLKSESKQGGGDDTALNGVELFCNDGNHIHSGVGPWGSWTGWTKVCTGGYTKVKIRVEGKQVRDKIERTYPQQ